MFCFKGFPGLILFPTPCPFQELHKALIAHVTPGLGLQKLLDVPQRNCAVNVLDYCCEGTDAGSFQAGAALPAGARRDWSPRKSDLLTKWVWQSIPLAGGVIQLP